MVTMAFGKKGMTGYLRLQNDIPTLALVGVLRPDGLFLM